MAQDDLSSDLAALVGALKTERGPCPSESALVEYRALSAEDRIHAPIDAHVRICSRCQLVLLHLDDSDARGVPFSWRWAAAAALVLALVVPMMYQRFGTSPPETIRGTDLQVVAPAGQVDAVTAFEWLSPIRADRYRVRLLRGGQEIWSATTDATRLPVAVDAPRLDRGVE
jgi:hypothetical protein